jgi:uncharacterized membrane protein
VSTVALVVRRRCVDLRRCVVQLDDRFLASSLLLCFLTVAHLPVMSTADKMRRMQLGLHRPSDAPDVRTVMSCTLSEAVKVHPSSGLPNSVIHMLLFAVTTVVSPTGHD